MRDTLILGFIVLIWHVCVTLSVSNNYTGPIKPGTAGGAVGSSCGSVSFDQMPGVLNGFVSRHLINTNPNPCSGSSWYLGVDSYNWQESFKEVGSILMPPVSFGGHTVSTAYDPTVAKFVDGTSWIAFECGDGISVNSCAAPMDANFQVDTARLSMVIQGTPASSPNGWYSSSVPKLFVWQGRSFLYWTVVQISSTGTFLGLTVRGTEVAVDSAGLLFQIGQSNSISTNDPSTIEVFGPDASTSIADGYQAFTWGNYIWFMASKGPSGCTAPDNKIPGCYRMAIGRSKDPLGTLAFNQEWLDQAYLPPGSASYTRFVNMPDGSYQIISSFSPNGDSSLTGMYFMLLPNIPFFQDSMLVAQKIPAQLPRDTNETVYIFVFNTGLIQFTESEKFRVGAIGPNAGSWGVSRGYLDSNAIIQPGAVGAYTFNVTTPSNPGKYTFQWQMLQEGVDWFGNPGDPVVVQIV